MKLTEIDNVFLDMFKGKKGVTEKEIRIAVKNSQFFREEREQARDEAIDKAVERIYTKLQTINSEYIQWFEVLLSLIFATIRIYGSNMDAILPKNLKTT